MMKTRNHRILRSVQKYAAVCAVALTSMSVVSLGAAEAEKKTETKPALSLGEQETKARQEFETKVIELIAKGLKRADEKDYAAAFKCFRDAEKMIDGASQTQQDTLRGKLDSCRSHVQHIVAQEKYRICKDSYLALMSSDVKKTKEEDIAALKDKLNDAKSMYYLGDSAYSKDKLEAAIKQDPSFASRVQMLLNYCDNLAKEKQFKTETTLSEMEHYEEGNEPKKVIAKLYREGERLYREKKYMQVRDKMEQILIKDPFNEKAMFLLEKTYKRLYFIADMRQWNEFLRDQTSVEWNWMENVPGDESVGRQIAPRESIDRGSALYERLNSLILPDVEFVDADLQDAIRLLNKQSKELDPERGGVNIVYRPKSDVDQPRVTLQLGKVPLLQAIKYLCDVAGMQYRVSEKDNALYIGDLDDFQDMETRFFPVRYQVIQRLTGEDISVGKSTKDSKEKKEFSVDSFEDFSMEDTFKDEKEGDDDNGKKKKTSINSAALKRCFAEYGIPFGPRTSIAYDKRSNKLTVVNTRENLQNLELLLREMDVVDPLVLIESKVLEIKMTDLEELGFDWLLTHNNDNNPRWNWSMESPIRNSGFTNNILINNMNILPNFGGDNVWSLYLTVYAVDRTDRGEVLATPKVIANSGQEANIRMVREMYFPDSWTEPEISTSCGSSVSFEPSYPEFGDATDIGISFTVTPQVSANNYTILLTMAPLLTDLTGWSDYSYNYVLGNFGSVVDNTTPAETLAGTSTESSTYKATLKMPEISVRTVETNVKVYDGQTVVVGGIMKDKTGTMSDQWPLFGDIPLLGRLFQESASSTQKDNLLISVTTRLISGDGVPIRASKQNGLPDFRR